jgi:hypothetical protein
MQPQGWITGWLELCDQTLHGFKIIVAKDMWRLLSGGIPMFSVLSVSSVVNPFTNEFSPETPEKVGSNTM